MKKYIKEQWSSLVVAIIIVAAIVVATKMFPYEFALQYVQDGELVTETFTSTKDFNSRAQELRAQGITYYLD